MGNWSNIRSGTASNIKSSLLSDFPFHLKMPYRCQKCMNTFKTLSLYNRHAVDCKHIKGETKVAVGSVGGRGSQGRTVQSFGGSGSAVVKRNFSDSGTGQSSYSPQNK